MARKESAKGQQSAPDVNLCLIKAYHCSCADGRNLVIAWTSSDDEWRRPDDNPATSELGL